MRAAEPFVEAPDREALGARPDLARGVDHPLTAPSSTPLAMKRCSSSASRMTGTIMMMITTHIDHHRTPFSPAFMAATRIGMVCARLVDRNSASRYSFQERI